MPKTQKEIKLWCSEWERNNKYAYSMPKKCTLLKMKQFPNSRWTRRVKRGRSRRTRSRRTRSRRARSRRTRSRRASSRRASSRRTRSRRTRSRRARK